MYYDRKHQTAANTAYPYNPYFYNLIRNGKGRESYTLKSVRSFLEAWKNDGYSIIDPMYGSGVIADYAEKFDLDVIGNDKDPAMYYFNLLRNADENSPQYRLVEMLEKHRSSFPKPSANQEKPIGWLGPIGTEFLFEVFMFMYSMCDNLETFEDLQDTIMSILIPFAAHFTGFFADPRIGTVQKGKPADFKDSVDEFYTYLAQIKSNMLKPKTNSRIILLDDARSFKSQQHGIEINRLLVGLPIYSKNNNLTKAENAVIACLKDKELITQSACGPLLGRPRYGRNHEVGIHEKAIKAHEKIVDPIVATLRYGDADYTDLVSDPWPRLNPNSVCRTVFGIKSYFEILTDILVNLLDKNAADDFQAGMVMRDFSYREKLVRVSTFVEEVARAYGYDVTVVSSRTVCTMSSNRELTLPQEEKVMSFIRK